MFPLVSIIYIFSLPTFVLACDDQEFNVWHYSYIIGIIIGSSLCTIIGTFLAYCILRSWRRKLASAEPYVDDVPTEKKSAEDSHVVPELPSLYQVQPILTVSEVVASVKQSFNEMGDAVLPRRWVRSKPPPPAEVEVNECVVD